MENIDPEAIRITVFCLFFGSIAVFKFFFINPWTAQDEEKGIEKLDYWDVTFRHTPEWLHYLFFFLMGMFWGNLFFEDALSTGWSYAVYGGGSCFVLWAFRAGADHVADVVFQVFEIGFLILIGIGLIGYLGSCGGSMDYDSIRIRP